MADKSDRESRLRFFKVIGLTAAAFGLEHLLPSGLFRFPRLYAAGPKSCGPPPPAAPKRITGGESFPPLPLPATPLRRTERKREPSPPTLIGKVQHGQLVWGTDESGNRFQYPDWTTDPSDVKSLLDWANASLGIRYRPVEMTLDRFSFTPAEIPVLYFTGHEGFNLTDEEAAGIQRYLYDGGYVIGDACCGDARFQAAFVREFSRILPARQRAVLASDHPLYESCYKIDKVAYQVEGKGQFNDVPHVEGINIGCRTAVFFTRYDLSCGWDRHTHDQGQRVMPSHALQIGANLITYVLACYQLGRFLSTKKVYYQDKLDTRDEFVLGQIMHDGDWDPAPSAAMNLMKYVARNSTLDVQMKRADVDLAKPLDVFKHSFLYITGHRDFVLADPELATLRKFLTHGGVLLGDACCGRVTFDAAFRRELARVLPGAKLEPLPLTHPLFSSLARIATVQYTDFLKQSKPGFNAPVVEGLTLNGRLAVIYSPYDLGCGWEEIDHPYGRGLAGEDALKLAANTLVYAMTH